MIKEENICLEKYSNSYKDYMKKVPRYFLFFKKGEK
jgi:protein-S-isoprenylcysteine O-methyltransferase Ste14